MVAALAVLALAPARWPLYSQVAEPSEYQVKAAFLFGFAKFIDWPETTFASANSPFTVCVIGEDPFGPILDEALRGKRIQNRNVEIARFASPAAVGSSQECQMSFVSTSERQRYREAVARFHGANTLLIGDEEGFASAGGAIEFLLESGHVRFAINPEAAERAGLKVSSKLLALAKIVHES